MVIVNSHKVAQDLLHERKLFHRLFGTHASVRQFVPLILTEVHKLLRNILLNPDRLVDEITQFVDFPIRRVATGAITIQITYGYHLCDGPNRDPLLEMFETGGNNFFILGTPAAFLADIIPICPYMFSNRTHSLTST
ncbi:hypothetical protein B0H14DRAFT_2871118 [Mycena olivaceomarginata]|nr:hypothetical protein B0H14DRAFT_2871118 [Mycena olivaceomarginata]